LVQAFADSQGIIISCSTILKHLNYNVSLDSLLEQERPEVVIHVSGVPFVSEVKEIEFRLLEHLLTVCHFIESCKNAQVKNFLTLSRHHGCWDPGIMGQISRLLEAYCSAWNESDLRVLVLRIPYVYESYQSVIADYAHMIQGGLEVQGEHPQSPLFFVLMEDLVQEFLHMMALGMRRGRSYLGGVFLMKVTPVILKDLLSSMIRLWNNIPYRERSICFSGLQKELPKESIVMVGEKLTPTSNPLLFHAKKNIAQDWSQVQADIQSLKTMMKDGQISDALEILKKYSLAR
jgi:FlaA1/EpsC-like NDP-sugar epimerase